MSEICVKIFHEYILKGAFPFVIVVKYGTASYFNYIQMQ